MSSKVLSQKLSLRKETLTRLTEEDTSRAVGGTKVYTNYTCGEVVSCYDTSMHPCL